MELFNIYENKEVILMGKVKNKEILTELLDQSTNDWNDLCDICKKIVDEANMTSEDISKIVESVKKENG